MSHSRTFLAAVGRSSSIFSRSLVTEPVMFFVADDTQSTRPGFPHASRVSCRATAAKPLSTGTSGAVIDLELRPVFLRTSRCSRYWRSMVIVDMTVGVLFTAGHRSSPGIGRVACDCDGRESLLIQRVREILHYFVSKAATACSRERHQMAFSNSASRLSVDKA